MSGTKTISVVVPLFNEAAILDELWSRLSAVLDGLAMEAEVIFVDDGSSDETPTLLKALCEKDKRVRRIKLSRNFGHQCALTAGIDHTSGDAVVLMDGDLQDKPEAIHDFVRKWKEGFEVVYAIRATRQESAIMRMGFKSFYGLLTRMSGISQPVDAGIFCLIDRRVVDLLKSMPERNRYFPGLRAYAGFSQTGIAVDRDPRFAGTPRVGLVGLVKLALDGIISFSYVPIRLVTFTGLAVATMAFGYVGVIMYKKFISHVAIPGWSSQLTAILFLGGLQLITLGIVGEYIGRIYEEVKQRPYYIVAEKQNFE